MSKARFVLLAAGLLVLSGGTVGQEKKKEEPKDPAVKAKGQLPPNWSKLGLTDEQKQKVYQIHSKYKDEIDKLQAKITELKEKQRKESLEILTDDQKKRLDEIAKEKTGTGKDKDKDK
jgi:hypothetical protein